MPLPTVSPTRAGSPNCIVITSTASLLIALVGVAVIATLRLAAAVELVSTLPNRASQQITANGASDFTGFAGNGRYVFFVSEANDLLQPSLAHPKANLYRRDLTTGATLLISRGLDGKGLSEGIIAAQPSDDGMSVAYTTAATNVVPVDLNDAADLFVYDANSGQTTLISAADDGIGSAESGVRDFAFSGDGRWLAFTSSSTNLSAPSPGRPNSINVYLHDRQTTNTVSAPDSNDFVATYGLPRDPQINHDGGIIVFESRYVPNSSLLRRTTLLIWRRADNSVSRVFLPGERPERSAFTIPIEGATLNPIGEYLLFRAWDLNFPEDAGLKGIYRVPLATGVAELIHPEPLGSAYNSPLFLAESGDTAAFTSFTEEGAEQVRVWNRGSGVKTLAELAPNTVADPASSEAAGLSSDGRWLALGSRAAVPPAGVTEAGDRRLYLWELATGQARELARQEEPSPVGFNGDTSQAVFVTDDAGDGAHDRNELTDVFLANVVTGAKTILTVADPESPSATPIGKGSFVLGVSDDGRYVAFQSDADGLVPSDTNGSMDLFVHDRQTRSNRLVNVNQPGPAAVGPVRFRQISSDGQHVLFWSLTDEIAHPNPNFPEYHYPIARQYLWNLATGETELTLGLDDLPDLVPPVNWTGHVPWDGAQMSRDGRYVMVWINGLMTFSAEVFLRDRWSGSVIALFREARRHRPAVKEYMDRPPILSPDGQTVILGSYVYRTATGTFDDLYPAGYFDGQGQWENLRFSADGRYAWYAEWWKPGGGLWVNDTATGSRTTWSSPANFSFAWRQAVFVGNEVVVPGRSATDATLNLYRIELFGGMPEPLLTTVDGQPVNGVCRAPKASADGRWIVFTSFASNLVPDDTNGVADVFALDRWTGKITCVSRDSERGAENVAAAGGLLSADGRVVVFETFGSSLVADDHNGVTDVVAVELSNEASLDSDDDGLPDGWERLWWNSLSNSATGDADLDGQSNLDEWRARTSPRQSTSLLRIDAVKASTAAQLQLHWVGRPGVRYQIQRTDHLRNASEWVPEGLEIMGRTGELSVKVPTSTSRFYRLTVIP